MWLVIGILLLMPLVTFQLGSEINPFNMFIRPILNWIRGGMEDLVGMGEAT
jgi:hypothetical protein